MRIFLVTLFASLLFVFPITASASPDLEDVTMSMMDDDDSSINGGTEIDIPGDDDGPNHDINDDDSSNDNDSSDSSNDDSNDSEDSDDASDQDEVDEVDEPDEPDEVDEPEEPEDIEDTEDKEDDPAPAPGGGGPA